MVPELKDLGYDERLKRLSLPSLVYPRFRGDIIETYKYIHGCYDVKSVLKMDTYGKTRGHKVKIFNERYNTNVRKRVLRCQGCAWMEKSSKRRCKCQIIELIQKETGRLLWRQKIFM